MITGDKNILTSGSEAYRRLELQRQEVERLEVLYWGRGSLWPQLPAGPFDVVTAQDPFWRGLFSWWLARRIGARFNVQVHTDLRRQPLLRRALARFVLKHSDSVRAVSEDIANQMERIGIRAPVTILPIFIDVEKYCALVRQPHTDKTILWMGRFEDEKDPLLAIEILKSVRRAGVDAKLIMLGAGSMKHALLERAHDLPVEFPGWQDPRVYLQTADVVLSTSRHESWGASIIEALAAGVPVVTPDVGVARQAGACVAAREKLAQEVLRVLETMPKATLRLSLPSKEEWAKKWKDSIMSQL